MKVAVAGAGGAFGVKHLNALKNINGVEVVSVVGRTTESIEALAKERGIEHYTTDLNESLSHTDVEAVILSTPTQMHADQSRKCMIAGKHVMCEIPMSDNIEDARSLVNLQKETGVVGMVGHVRRFNPSHQYVHNKIILKEFKIQQLDVQTYFFRRTNINALGNPRSWTDHLLWHHACHTVDLFIYQTGEVPTEVFGMQGPIHPDLIGAVHERAKHSSRGRNREPPARRARKHTKHQNRSIPDRFAGLGNPERGQQPGEGNQGNGVRDRQHEG